MKCNPLRASDPHIKDIPLEQSRAPVDTVKKQRFAVVIKCVNRSFSSLRQSAFIGDNVLF
ncbi:uncharacterized protein CCR75_003092 [Bremia lactucae]|uniref:Uncharacterized protein n=1 Tax=Bremia lactucae TaxID=4779 RepID=A0A976IKT6_BRELC|nr:hypothetical protein CCR75_003092 [Bremia lactucae]